MNVFALSGLSVSVSCALLASLLLVFGGTRLHRSLLAFNSAVALWGLGLFLVGIAKGEQLAVFGWRFAHAGGFFVAPTFYLFVTRFCDLHRRKLLVFAYLQALFFFSLLLATDLLFDTTRSVHGLHFMLPKPAYHPGLLLYLLIVLGSYTELLRFLPSARGRKRAQTLYIIFGFLLGFTGASFTFIPMYGFELFFPWGNFGITGYCLILAYAILRHRIMDIHVVFKKSLVYALSVGSLTGLFILLVLAATEYLTELTGVSSFTVTILSALLIAIIFAPLKNLIQAIVDRVFFERPYNFYDVVQRTSRDLQSTVNLADIHPLIVDPIFEALGLRRALLLSAGSKGYATVYSLTAKEAPHEAEGLTASRLARNSPLVSSFKGDEVLLKEELFEKHGEESARAAAADMELFGCEAAAPILVDGEPEHILLLGEKLSGDAFSPEDLDLLRTLSNQSSIALKNAALFNHLSRALDRLKGEMTERTNVETALRKSADEWRSTFDSTKDAILMLDQDGRVIRANRSASSLFHTPVTELAGKLFSDLFGGRTAFDVDERLYTSLQLAKHMEFEVQLAGEDRWIQVTYDPLRAELGKAAQGIVCIVRDTTEQKELQSQIVQSRKMESIGRLAGGVAHDFNNLLSIIIGYAELALGELERGDPQKERLGIILESGERAATLTRQLLAFSRKQRMELKEVGLLEIVSNLTKILSRTIGEDIQVEIKSSGDLPRIVADPSQIEQIIMNLALNARDAMPRGGRFTIDMKPLTIDNASEEIHELSGPGEYVCLALTDTGAGMSPEVLERIFEPFFTTKEVGEGTGLGLATVYGIVKQHGSHITVSSVPGEGTTFKIYFPASRKPAREESRKTDVDAIPGGTETIMVVEDEPRILALTQQSLESRGYRVLTAQDGEEAWKKMHAAGHPIDLLITDVIMPGMNGKELARRVRRRFSHTKIMYMSGYPDEKTGKYGVRGEGEVLIQKPATPSILAWKVREALDGPRGAT